MCAATNRFLKLFNAAILATACYLFTTAAHAQTCPEAEKDIVFGKIVQQRCVVASHIDDEYGVIRVSLDPPSAGQIIKKKDLKGSFLSGLFQDKDRAATLVLDLYLGQPPANAADPSIAQTTQIARIPLLTYTLDTKARLHVGDSPAFFDDFDATAPFLLRPSAIKLQGVSGILRVFYGNKDSTTIVANAAPIVRTAAAFGGHGWAVSAFTQPQIVEDLSKIENWLNKSRQGDVSGNYQFNLSFAEGAVSAVTFKFVLDPKHPEKATAGEYGALRISLQRRLSIFTTTVTSGIPPLPAYPLSSPPAQSELGAILGIKYGSSDVTLFDYLAHSDPTGLAALRLENVDPVQWNAACQTLSSALDKNTLGLSQHDKEAVFYASLAQQRNLDRLAIRSQSCVSGELAKFRQYGFSTGTAAKIRVLGGSLYATDGERKDAMPFLGTFCSDGRSTVCEPEARIGVFPEIPYNFPQGLSQMDAKYQCERFGTLVAGPRDTPRNYAVRLDCSEY